MRSTTDTTDTGAVSLTAQDIREILAEYGPGVTREELREMIREAVAVCHKEVLNVKEAAAFLGVGVSHLYKMMQARALPYFQPGGKKCFFKRTDLEAWMTQCRICSDEELDFQAAAIKRTLPTLAELTGGSKRGKRTGQAFF